MIGKLRHLITIQRGTRVEDGAGGGEVAWQDLPDQVWAEITPVRASERFFAGKLEENISHTVRLRDRFEVDADMRILFEGRVFQIRGVTNPDERSRWTILKCEEGTAS